MAIVVDIGNLIGILCLLGGGDSISLLVQGGMWHFYRDLEQKILH